MSADSVPAGAFARARARALAHWGIAAIAVLAAVPLLALLSPLSFWPLVAVQLAGIGGIVALDRLLMPHIDRWAAGARGEEHVGALLEPLGVLGWRWLHDVDLGRGNVDHVVIGPGGLFTIETKAGRSAGAERIDGGAVQAYVQARAIERVTGTPTTPLLVFTEAWLRRTFSRRRGVLVIPARVLVGHLGRQAAVLTPVEVEELHARLAAAVR